MRTLICKKHAFLPIVDFILGCHARHCMISMLLHVCFLNYPQASRLRLRAELACKCMLSDVPTLVEVGSSLWVEGMYESMVIGVSYKARCTVSSNLHVYH